MRLLGSGGSRIGARCLPLSLNDSFLATFDFDGLTGAGGGMLFCTGVSSSGANVSSKSSIICCAIVVVVVELELILLNFEKINGRMKSCDKIAAIYTPEKESIPFRTNECLGRRSSI